MTVSEIPQNAILLQNSQDIESFALYVEPLERSDAESYSYIFATLAPNGAEYREAWGSYGAALTSPCWPIRLYDIGSIFRGKV